MENQRSIQSVFSAKLNEILVKEGEEVKAGQTLALLDPKDIQVVVNERSANYQRAAADFKRAKGLVGKGHISRADYDQLDTNSKTTRATLEQARNDLGYTGPWP